MFKLLLIIALLPFAAFNQGYQVNLQGQIQQGMASAGTALIQDAAALFYNPGGVSFLNKNEASIGMTPTFANATFLENTTFETARTVSPLGTPFTAYGLFQLADSSKLKLGLAIYTPFGSTIEWEPGWVGRFAVTRLQLKAIFFQPTVSYRITDKIGLGAGFIYTTGSVNLQKDLPLLDQNGDYAHVELAGKGYGFGYNLGLYLEPTEHLSVGLTYRSEIAMNLTKGTATFTVPNSVEDKFPSGDFTSSLPLPQVLTLAVAVKPNDKLAIALDMNYVGWDAYDTLAFDYVLNTESLEDTKSPRHYVGTVAIRLGAQYKINNLFTARMGIGYALSPVQNGYLTPETPDANRVNYTAGFGYHMNDQFDLNASLLFTQIQREDTNIETQLSGTFKAIVFAPGISVAYKF